mgnify:CR=1 FL=1|tara:strand:+ start:4297 stop:5049 length:753 start_codon:yes stop_codon:yes gene_type:complete
MLPKLISSLQHPLIKHLIKLRQKCSYRTETQSLLIIGKKIILERRSLKNLLIAEGETPPPALSFDQVYRVPKYLFKKISGVNSPESFAAEVPLPLPSSLNHKQKILALDGVQDPGNVGTLIRTGLALGFDGLFLVKGSADLFNEKVLRAAKSAVFDIPYQIGSQTSLWSLINSGGFSPYAGDLKGKDPSQVSFSRPLVLILSNEGRGPCKETKEKATLVSIDMLQKVESLNVAIAGGILMYQITRSTNDE